MRLKPFISHLRTEYLEQSFEQFVAPRIDLFQVGHLLKGIGQITTSAARYGHFGQHLSALLKNGDTGLRHHLFQVDRQKKTGRTTAYNRNIHHSSHFSVSTSQSPIVPVSDEKAAPIL